MPPTPQRTTINCARNFRLDAFPARRFIARVLAFILLAQTIAPPALAAPTHGLSLTSLGSHALSSLSSAIGKLGGGDGSARADSVQTVASMPVTEEFGVVLTPLSTAFAGHTGIEHHQPLRKVVVSSNHPTGMPLNFEALDADGTHRPHSNVAGLTGGVKIATARDDGAGISRGGFKPGELFSGTGVPGVIARVAADGASVQNPWVTLAGEAGQLSGGLFVDRTGVFGGDLIAVTTAGGVWRVNSAGAATRLADFGTHLAGVTTIPDDPTRYGPWAGKILAGAKDEGRVYALDAQGNSTAYELGINAEDIRVIPAHENFYGVDPAGGKIWGAPDDAFAGLIGDILIAQGSPGVLARVRWNGTEFEVGRLAEVEQWGQITFSPAALSEIGGVRQVYDKIAVVRHAPQLDSGRVEGALWQLLPENVVLDGTDAITSDLLVPGVPTVTIGSGKPSFDGVIEGVESTQPGGYSITISNNARLRHVITRTNPLSLLPVSAPPAPTGTRDVSLSKAGDTIGNPATLRDLSISGKAGAVAIPPGAYGKFTANGHTAFVLGVEGATEPSVYNLEELSLSGGSELRLLGRVKLNVRGNVSLSGSTVGAADNPQHLLLSVAQGALGVIGNGVLYAVVRNPQGSVSIGGNGRIRGTVTCDRLNIFGNGVLQITENDVAPPPVNRPPVAEAGPDQTIALPTDVVSLNATATDDGLPLNSTLSVNWTKVSGPGTVTFADAGRAATSATFSEAGVYVLRLSVNDSLLTVSDEVSVEVFPRNRPPVVNAGLDQTIELPNTATLAGIVTDDALPRGSNVTKRWSVVSGPADVAFADPHAPATVATFAAPGDYTLRLTADDTEFSVSDDVVITVHPENQPPVVNAGADQTVRLPTPAPLNGTATDDGQPFASTLKTKWTQVSGPGAVTFADPASPSTSAQFSVEGTYVLRLSADDTRFNVSDECTVTVLPRNAPPSVEAGASQEITFLEPLTLNGTASDDEMPVGSVLEVAWTKVSGSGTVTFDSPDSPVTAVTFSAPGTYVLRLTGDDTQFSAFDETTVVVRPRAHAARVYTLDADFDEGSLVNLAHSTPDQLQLDTTTSNVGTWSVVFDSQIAGAEWGRIGWTAQVCGDGLLTVAVATSDDNAAYTQPLVVSNGDDPEVPNGRYIKISVSFERASSGESPVLYDLSVGTLGFPLDTPPNVAPGVDAGSPQTLNDTMTATLRASACDDALPSNRRLSMTWSQVSGPGTATFAHPDSPFTDVTFSDPGTYTLRMNASDSVHQSSDTLVITVLPGNQPPVVNAGTDQTITLPATASLNGTLTDDGLPSGGTLTSTWSKLSGTGHVTFGNANQTTTTTASFSEAGTYVLRLEASDSQKSAFDDVTVNVLPRPNAPPEIISEPPTEFALSPAPTGAGELVNLSPWTVKQYELNSQPNASWVKDLANNRVTQTVNADASFLLSDFDLARAQMDGTWRVDTTSDDDFIGFVFGYQNSEHFYLFDWKQSSQNDSLGFAERGMSVKVVNADSPLTGRDFWPTAGNGTRVRTLYHNTIGWSEFTDYQFTLQFHPGEIKIIVRQGANVLADITVKDQTYTNGLFGFYNYSQAQVRYSGFRRLSLTQGTYTYDVEASDPDGDAVAYSLTAAPAGMSINPTTGLINWPVTSREAGDHSVTVRAQDPQGAFDTQSYTLSIFNQNHAPIVNAGPDRALAINSTATLSGTVTDDGLPRNSALSSSWSMVSGPGLVAFADPASPTTTATFSEAGTYVLRLTATDTALTASDETIITVTPPNQAPHVNAGSDLTITQPGAARLDATATDDGLPLNSTLSVNWTKVSGPGTVTFADAGRAVTSAIFTEPGLYVLRLSASDTELTSVDDVSVTVNPPAPNQPPVVEAGANQTVALNANLVANGGNDEQLAGTEIRAWTEAVGNLWTRGVSGADGFPESANGDGFFYAGAVDAAELRQDVDVSAFAATIAAGTQSFEWKASVRSRAESVPDSARLIVEYRNQANTTAIAWTDTGEVASVDAWRLLENKRTAPAGTGWIRLRLIATRRTGTTNDAYFDALSLRAVTGAGVKLSGTVSDDGLPAGGALANNWTKISGPGTVTFADAGRAATSATFSEAGVYVLRLTANDAELTSGDELSVTVEPRNLAPTVEAGDEQTITLPATALLNGVVTDDGRPANALVTSQWSKLSGPGAVTFTDASAPLTNAAFAEEGTYVLRLTASDGEYSSSDTVTINVKPVPSNLAPTVNAGADQLINPPATSATLNGTVTDDGRPPSSSLTYAWTKVSGPGTVSFSNPAALATTANFGEAGVYVLRLTADDTELTGSDDVRITVNGTNKAPVVNAGADQTVAHPTIITLGGSATDDGLPIDSTLHVTWSKVSGPGTVTFLNAAALKTNALFSAPGVYVLRLTASDNELTSADEVSITQTPPPTVGISSPADGATITGRTNFVGTVSEGSTWRLEYSLNEEGSAPVWTTFASGNTPVTNGVLGTFDPTALLNGIYTVRLLATNAGGQTTIRSQTVIADGGQKVGHFSISFTDLNVPLAGIPIQVVRTYDSRDKRAGDFGVGWTLDVRNMRLQESGDLGAGWRGTFSSGFLPSYCIEPTRPHSVSITLPSNEVLRFEAVVGPQCSLLYPLSETTISYRALPGTNARLAPVGDATVFVNANFPGDAELLDYSTFDEKDFDQYRLTLPNGAEFIIDQRAGLRQATDASGNRLTIDSNGITHSSGKRIAFTRDAQGRITRITDPAGAATTYAYDARGDLVSFIDRENNNTTFAYNSNHDLLSIKDPRGLQPVRNEYDSSGRLVRQIDAFGKVVNFTHDLDTRQVVTTDRLGHTTVNEYNARGQVVRITDALGGVTTFAYDNRDNLIRETNSEGQIQSYTYDAQDNRLTETDPLGKTTRYTYNAKRQLLTVTDPLGRVTTNTYDASGNLTSVKDALGHTTTNTYDGRGLLLSVTDPLGNITRFEYDASGNLTKEIDPLGNSVSYTFDANGNQVSETTTRTVAPGVVETVTNIFQYDREGRQTKVSYPNGSAVETSYNNLGDASARVNMLGHRTTFEYDELRRLVGVTFPDGKKEQSEFDAEGRRIKTTDRSGRSTLYQYDALGRLVRTTFSDGTSASTTYNTLGHPVTITDTSGRTMRFEYDAAGRQTKTIDASGNTTTVSYDAFGQETSITDAKGQVTRFEYDTVGNLTKVIYPDGTFATSVYDAQGRVSAQTDQGGRTTRFEYDKAGQVARVIDAAGGVTSYTYDERGALIAQTDANNHTTTFEYDRLGLRVRRTLPLGMSETYGYNAGGQLTTRTDFRGKTTTFAYDVMSRLVTKTPDASLGEPPITYTYTDAGQRATMNDASGTTTYTYDALYRLTSKQTPQGTLSYTYDAPGRLLTLRSSNAGGVSTDYAYDTLGRLSAVTDKRQPQAADTTSYTYDANGNLSATLYPNGVQTSYTYNSLNRLTKVEAAKGAALASYAYTLGAAGQRLSVNEHTGRSVSYTYDALYRLTSETITNDAANAGALSYTYDAVGNRLSRVSTSPSIASATYGYDANDRLNTEAYDANGNPVTSGGNSYAYDFENRLTEVGGGVRYVYDGDGNRVAKTVGGVTTRYLVDTNNPTGHAQVVEELQDGAVVRQYTYGRDLISQRQFISGQWRTSFYGYDGHGSVRQLTDDAGIVTDTFDYDAFGALINRTGTTPNEYLFAGERFDPETGLYYLRARYMNASTGRFWTMDWYEGRALEPLSLHKYLYAHADPVNNLDPTGFLTVSDLSTTQQIQSVLLKINRTYDSAMNLLNKAQTLAKILDYATLVSDILTALSAPTTTRMKADVLAALRRNFGAKAGMSISSITAGFQQVIDTIGPHWRDISDSIGNNALKIAKEITPGMVKRLPKLYAEEKAGKLKQIFYAPTAPTGAKGRKDKFVSVRPDLLLAVGIRGGGRIFGIGFQRQSGQYEQIVRIDYWDGRDASERPTPTPLHIHYHVFSEKHPLIPKDRSRTIWP
ncbi:MAG TPA: RHS repeat-associated core domain-containing protein [Pyrinomonadaceae bacterium]|nr:RHS repeat-associated core domain-containing protein [Pyrinomonadaceae bacterium]